MFELEFASATTLSAAAGLLAGSATADERLSLQVPGDGSVASPRQLLAALEDAGVEVEQISIHTPDLDDVFFAVTGHPTAEESANR